MTSAARCCIALLLLRFFAAGGAPPGCVWTEPDSSLACDIRTIDSLDSLIFNISRSGVDHLSSLYVQCSDVLFFESTLQTRQRTNSTHLGRLKKLVELRIDYCKIRSVPPLVFSHFRDLKNLHITTHNGDWTAMTMEFDSESFRGLTELRTLDLSDNNIWTFPVDMFCPLYSLKFLNLTKNRIQNVTDFGFSDRNDHMKTCNTPIEVLDISLNSLTNINNNIFSSLRTLKKLYLQENDLTVLEDKSLFGLTELQLLNVSCNFLTSLPPELFRATLDIRQIFAQNNSLSVLAPGLFEGLEQLQILDLSHNKLSNKWINRNTLPGLVRLIVLNLSYNTLTKIDSHLLSNLYSLQVLNVEHNQIETIAEDAFAELKNLHALTLSYNKLKQIKPTLFSALYVINELFIDHNEIEDISEVAFQNVTNLQDLGLSSNKIQSIPEAIKNLAFLKSLDLGNNNISFINSSSLAGLHQLYGIRLVDNLISEITKDTFEHLPALQVLNLASNKIHRIEPNAFKENVMLKAVRLDDNNIHSFSSVFNNLNSLIWLNVSYNKLKWVDYHDYPYSLEWLNLHGNLIRGFKSDLTQTLTNIKTLDLSYNYILELTPSAVPNSVETFLVNNNNISKVDSGTFSQKTNLLYVALNNNRISFLDISSFSLSLVPEGQKIPDFLISGNPYMCDCSMEWLLRINQLTHTRQYPQIIDLDNVTCSSTHLREKDKRMVIDLKPSQFLCPYESHCFALCHCCDFDACDCEMTCPDRCFCFHDVTWSANVVDCSNAGYVNVPQKIPMDATEIYLDGNNIQELGSHVFIGKKNLRVLYLNNTNLQNVNNQTFKGVESLRVLHLESNKLVELKGNEFDHLQNLNELYLDHNAISSVATNTFNAMKNLEVLRLDDNKMSNFSPWQLLASASKNLAHVSLEGNKWTCDCKNIDGIEVWLQNKSTNIDKLYCFDYNGNRTMASFIHYCKSISSGVNIFPGDTLVSYQTYVAIFACVIVGVIMFLLVGALMYAFRHNFSSWIHTKYRFRFFKEVAIVNSNPSPNTGQISDGFVLYSDKDEYFVIEEFIPELDHRGYCLRIHSNNSVNFSENSFSWGNFSKSLSTNCYVIIVLSSNFLLTECENVEFKEFISDYSSNRNVNIIFVSMVNLGSVNMKVEVASAIQKFGVINWGDGRFWETLQGSVPDVLRVKPVKVASDFVLKIMRDNSSPNLRYTASPITGGVGSWGRGSAGFTIRAIPRQRDGTLPASAIRASRNKGADGSNHGYVSVDNGDCDGDADERRGASAHVYSAIAEGFKTAPVTSPPPPPPRAAHIVTAAGLPPPGKTYFV